MYCIKIGTFLYFRGQACRTEFLAQKLDPKSVFQEQQINPILLYS